MCKPILPLLQDELAHSFWEAQHLATVHTHHGDHHAEDEIAEAEHDDHDTQSSASKISEPVSVHIAVEIVYHIAKPYQLQHQFDDSFFNVSSLSLDKSYPPPRYC